MDFLDDWKCPICQVDKTHMIQDNTKKDSSRNVTVSDVMVETLIKFV